MSRTVFWAWQSDRDEKVCHYFIRDVLQAVCTELSEELRLEESERADVDYDTKGVTGTPEIFATILKKIRAASVFMADVTPVARTEGGKPCANPNVMIELGHAFAHLPEDRVFIIANSFWYADEDELPFDLRHRRKPILYDLPPEADTTTRKAASVALKQKLKGWISAALGADKETIEFPGAPSRAGDASVWFDKGDALKHRDFHSGGGPEHVVKVLEKKPRSYIRIIPAGWRNGEPRRDALLSLPSHTQFFAPGTGITGNGGPNSQGLLRYWLAGRPGDAQAISAAQVFRTTGEIWAFDGQVSDADRGVDYVICPQIVRGWAQFLMTSIALLEHWQARLPIRVTVGVVGMTGFHWPPRIGARAAYDDAMSYTEVQRPWDEKGQRDFLVSASASLYDVFGLPAPTEEGLGDLIRPATV